MGHDDSWSFKSRANMTVDPAAPGAITTSGVRVALVTANGTVLDQVAYNGTSCKATRTRGSLRRIQCRVKGQAGKLSFVHAAKSNATYSVTGSFQKRNINGTTAANEAPLGVVVAVGADGSGTAFGGRCVSRVGLPLSLHVMLSPCWLC